MCLCGTRWYTPCQHIHLATNSRISVLISERIRDVLNDVNYKDSERLQFCMAFCLIFKSNFILSILELISVNQKSTSSYISYLEVYLNFQEKTTTQNTIFNKPPYIHFTTKIIQNPRAGLKQKIYVIFPPVKLDLQAVTVHSVSTQH